ncbi:MAG: hypothetical protein H6815_01250 [Phycisphaeraceae bacterium]|nr:hypothetical protein [Phycisphaerales bacterium]MCB9859053.1 hypothetical protein [Phycisphaeraceae bacterium]
MLRIHTRIRTALYYTLLAGAACAPSLCRADPESKQHVVGNHLGYTIDFPSARAFNSASQSTFGWFNATLDPSPNNDCTGKDPERVLIDDTGTFGSSSGPITSGLYSSVYSDMYQLGVSGYLCGIIYTLEAPNPTFIWGSGLGHRVDASRTNDAASVFSTDVTIRSTICGANDCQPEVDYFIKDDANLCVWVRHTAEYELGSTGGDGTITIECQPELVLFSQYIHDILYDDGKECHSLSCAPDIDALTTVVWDKLTYEIFDSTTQYATKTYNFVGVANGGGSITYLIGPDDLTCSDMSTGGSCQVTTHEYCDDITEATSVTTKVGSGVYPQSSGYAVSYTSSPVVTQAVTVRVTIFHESCNTQSSDPVDTNRDLDHNMLDRINLIVRDGASASPDMNGASDADYDIRCDLDLDGDVDSTDLALLDAEFCFADLDEDGNLDTDDQDLFTTWYNAQDPRADMNGDTYFTIADYTLYGNLYSAGCP